MNLSIVRFDPWDLGPSAFAKASARRVRGRQDFGGTGPPSLKLWRDKQYENVESLEKRSMPVKVVA
jgi:hypothetical protein